MPGRANWTWTHRVCRAHRTVGTNRTCCGRCCERAHPARAAEMASRARVEERRIRLDDVRGQAIAAVIRAVVSAPALGLSDEQRREGLSIAARELPWLGAPT
jgi:hypothetical protein